MDTSAIIKAAAVFGAISALATGAYAITDYAEIRPVTKKEMKIILAQVESTSEAVLLLQYQMLMERMKSRPLTVEEQIQLCQIVSALKISGVSLC